MYYYVDFDTGDDSNAGTRALPWKHSPGDANASGNASSTTPSGDDFVVLKGGVIYRGDIVFNFSGTSGHNITLLSGHNLSPIPWGETKAIIDGSPLLSGWSDEGGNVWSIACSSEPECVFFVETDDSITRGVPDSTPDAEYDWDWDTNVLYVYSATSPDTRYTHVSAALNTNGIYLRDDDYVTIDGFEIRFAYYYGIRCRDSNGIVMQNLAVHHVGSDVDETKDAILIQSSSNTNASVLLKDSWVYEGGRHCVSVTAGGGNNLSDVTIQDCVIYDGFHNLIDCQVSGTSQLINLHVLRNLMFLTRDPGHGVNAILMLHYDTATHQDVVARNNFVYNMSASGFSFTYAEGVDVLNNTFVNCAVNGIHTGDGCSDVRILNNIAIDCDVACVDIDDSTDIAAMDYNCWFQSGDSGGTDLANIDGTGYSDWATYLAAVSFDDNSINAAPAFTAKPTDYGDSADFSYAYGGICSGTGADLESSDGFSVDYLGTARPTDAWDIGAYQAVASTGPTPAQRNTAAVAAGLIDVGGGLIS